MFVAISFTRDDLKGRIEHCLPHAHKVFPVLKRCLRDIDEKNGTYSLKDDSGKIVAQCRFGIDGNRLDFTVFDGELKYELRKMLMYSFLEDLGEKAYISTEDDALYYDADIFYMVRKDGVYKVGTDYESLVRVERYHLPVEIRGYYVSA